MPARWPLDSRDRNTALVMVVANLSIPGFVLLARHSSGLSDSAGIWTGWIAIALTSAVFLFILHSRSRQAGEPIPSTALMTVAALALVSGMITAIAITTSSQPGDVPLAQSSIIPSHIKSEQKKLIAELMRRTAADSAENTRAAKEMKPISPPLYSVSSFASKAAMESTISQLQQAYAIDLAYNAARDQTMRDFHNKMFQLDPVSLRVFESSMHDEEAAETAISSAEATWIASVKDLYAYAEEHTGVMTLAGATLQISDQDVQTALLAKIEASKALQQEMQTDRQKVVDKHRALQESLAASRAQ